MAPMAATKCSEKPTKREKLNAPPTKMFKNMLTQIVETCKNIIVVKSCQPSRPGKALIVVFQIRVVST
jgi:hypothetical protein